MEQFLALPNVTIPQPGGRHFDLLRELVVDHQAAGPLVTDCALASLCLEHGATLASTDLDFRRFPSLRRINPLE
jgi:uncharacterized protein